VGRFLRHVVKSLNNRSSHVYFQNSVESERSTNWLYSNIVINMTIKVQRIESAILSEVSSFKYA